MGEFVRLFIGVFVASWIASSWTQHMTLHEPFGKCLLAQKFSTCD